MKEKTVEKKILAAIEQRKTLWTAQIVLLSGLAAIATNLDSFIKAALFLIGLFFEVLIITSIKDTNKQLSILYKILEKI